MNESATYQTYIRSWRTGHAKLDIALLLAALLAVSASLVAALQGDSWPIIVCLVLTQVYHAWNQLRTLGMPARTWPGIMCAVMSDMLADNPIGGRLLLGGLMFMLQVLVMQLSNIMQAEHSRVRQLLTVADGVDTCSVMP